MRKIKCDRCQTMLPEDEIDRSSTINNCKNIEECNSRLKQVLESNKDIKIAELEATLIERDAALQAWKQIGMEQSRELEKIRQAWCEYNQLEDNTRDKHLAWERLDRLIRPDEEPLEEENGNWEAPMDYVDPALEYLDRTEAFDRTVCTGPVVDDEVRPASSSELTRINRNAKEVLADVARKHGISVGALRVKIRERERHYRYPSHEYPIGERKEDKQERD